MGEISFSNAGTYELELEITSLKKEDIKYQ